MSAVLLALTGCTADAPGNREGTGPKGLEIYFEQDVEWTDCRGGFECTEVKAPTDWDDPSSDPITLALLRQPADGDPKGTLFVNPGGPGASGIDLVESGWASPAVRKSLDVVGWDPRGVGSSTRVACGDEEAKDEFLYGTFDAPYDTQEWLDELTGEVAKFADECLKGTGDLLGHVDTVSTARDLELLRSLVGGGKLTYLGYSYGTDIGATYAELFPDQVGRMVLDGAVDPTLGAFEWLRVQYAGFESALRAYVDWCTQQSDCPFAGTTDDVMPQIDALIASVDGRGLQGPDGRTFDSATFGTAVSLAMYSEETWPVLSEAFAAVQSDDVELAFELADAYYERSPEGEYANNGSEVYTAVMCLDFDFAGDPKTTLERIAEIEEAAPTIGRYFAYDDYAVLDVACSHWPVETADRPAEYDAEGAAAIVVVGTTNDPATPYAWAESLASQLSSGQLVTVEGEGHTSYNQGNACLDSAIEDYLIDGAVPAEDLRC